MTSKLTISTLVALTILACGESDRKGNNGETTNTADAGSDTAQTGADAATTGEAIEAPNETWTWVEFPETRCGNGAPAGVGVNLTDRSDEVLVYFMGGGACWDVNTCFVLKSAVNIESGYGQVQFDNEAQLGASAFDRDEPLSAFKDMNFIFVPYCTGDLHAGDKVTTYEAVGQTQDVHHVGSTNVAKFLDRLGPTFETAPRVFVSGSSAGGYGAQLNAHQFADTFPNAEVHFLSDSGPLLAPYGSLPGAWNSAWALQPPAGCAGCETDFPAWLDFLTSNYPASRFGLLTYKSDQTIHLYFGYPAGDSFTVAQQAFIDSHMIPPPNAHSFVLTGTEHVMLGQLTTLNGTSGAPLHQWVSRWVSGDEWNDDL